VIAGNEIRAADAADLPRVSDIWYQDEIAGEEAPEASPGPLDVYAYLLKRGDMRVARGAHGAIAGFGATCSWPTSAGTLTYLTDLFVAPDIQSRGVGQALLRALLPGAGPRCTMASKDARAAALYIRAGMRPRWPNYWLDTSSATIAARAAALPGVELVVSETALDDEELARWDRETCGFERSEDLAWMVERRGALAHWLTRAGERVGYAVVQRRSEEALWRPDAWTIGPVGARTPVDAAACVGAIIGCAAERAPALRLAVPGPHPALTSLLAAGFAITYVETLLASEGGETFDAERYVTSGLFL
jgi:ribosomal protein S18 acetylase RimI-like enzyme